MWDWTHGAVQRPNRTNRMLEVTGDDWMGRWKRVRTVVGHEGGQGQRLREERRLLRHARTGLALAHWLGVGLGALGGCGVWRIEGSRSRLRPLRMESLGAVQWEERLRIEDVVRAVRLGPQGTRCFLVSHVSLPGPLPRDDKGPTAWCCVEVQCPHVPSLAKRVPS